MIEILARALGRSKFAAIVNGEVLVASTGTPLFATARVLAAAGIPDETEIALKHEGSEIVSIRSTVGRSKRLTVEERSSAGPRVRWFQSWDGSYLETAASDDTGTKS